MRKTESQTSTEPGPQIRPDYIDSICTTDQMNLLLGILKVLSKRQSSPDSRNQDLGVYSTNHHWSYLLKIEIVLWLPIFVY